MSRGKVPRTRMPSASMGPSPGIWGAIATYAATSRTRHPAHSDGCSHSSSDSPSSSRATHRDGQEDQLGALGLVLNCRALAELRAQGYPVLDEDIARLSAYMRKHINVHGHYSFRLPDLGGTGRPLRDPDHVDPTRTTDSWHRHRARGSRSWANRKVEILTGCATGGVSSAV